MQRALIYLAFAALLAPTAGGQDASSRFERFQLYNACRPFRLAVERLHDDAAAIGLDATALQAAAESRLRAARLYTEDWERADGAYLYLNVNVVSRSFNILVEYYKEVTDAYGITTLGMTWREFSTGTGGSAGYIVSRLSQHLDQFLAAYLRVNEEACGTPAGRP